METEETEDLNPTENEGNDENPKSEASTENSSSARSTGQSVTIVDQRNKTVSEQSISMDDFANIVGRESEVDSFSMILQELKQPESVDQPAEKKRKKKKKNITEADLERLSQLSVISEFSLHPTETSDTSVDMDGFTLIPIQTTVEEEEEEEEGEEEEVAEEEAKEARKELTAEEKQNYVRSYDAMTKELEELKARNSYYLKKLAQYYQKRRMFHVLHEGKVPDDVQKKYEIQLDEFYTLAKTYKEQQSKMQNELNDLKEKSINKEVESKQLFQKLQQDEEELAKEITSSEAEKSQAVFIERYLKRQRIQMHHIIDIRLKFVTLRNKYNEKQDALNALDNLGPDLHLIDYEELKSTNISLLDKLEEKDLELTKVRERCQNTVQILAHVREKITAVDHDNTDIRDMWDSVSGEYESVREQLNQMKQEKAWYRNAIRQMKESGGLITRPKMLKDLDNTVQEINSLTEQVNNVTTRRGPSEHNTFSRILP